MSSHLAVAKANPQQNTRDSPHCKLTILGGPDGTLQQASMACTGTPTAEISLHSTHLKSFKGSFTGVTLVPGCDSVVTKGPSCLITICSGSLVFRDSIMSSVPAIPLESLVCAVHNSRLQVFNNTFEGNMVRPIMVGGEAAVALHASNVSQNVVNGSGAGIWVDGDASVTITAGSRVEGNMAVASSTGGFGGGLYVVGSGRVVVAGGSSVSANMAPFGAGMWLAANASVNISGASSVHSNYDGGVGGFGGGLAMDNNARVVIAGGSSISNKTAAIGGGIAAGENTSIVLMGGSSVHGNTAVMGGGSVGSVITACASKVVSYLASNASADIHGASAQSNFDRGCGGFGGGVGLDNNARMLIASGSSISNNTAAIGAGLAAGANARVEIVGSSSVHGNAAIMPLSHACHADALSPGLPYPV
jgi:hypothetical protein